MGNLKQIFKKKAEYIDFETTTEEYFNKLFTIV